MKKGQVSIFIIIGILILAVVTILAFSKSGSLFTKSSVIEKPKELVKTYDASYLQTFVTECLKTTTLQGIQYNFATGGYNVPPLLSAAKNNLPIPFYWYNGYDVSPQKTDYEKQLNEYVEENIKLCLDFSAFKEITVKEKGEPTVTSEIQDGIVKMSLDFPLVIIDEPSEQDISEFQSSIELDVAKVIFSIQTLMEQQKKSPNTIQFTNLLNTAYQDHFKVKPVFEKDTVFYYLSFDDVLINGRPLEVTFAAKYDWQDTLKNSVDIKPVDVQFAEVGKQYSYKILSTGSSLQFSADTDLFSVNDVGEILFTPTVDEKGAYVIPIHAENSQGTDDENMVLVIQ